MMLRFSIQLVLVFLGASLALATSPSPDAPVSLLSEVELTTSSVRLSDLLPTEAPASLRTASAAVPLGRAPVAGSERRVTRAEIERALVDQPQILAGVSIPADITLRRVHRQLSLAEVAAAISSALGRENAVNPAALNLQLPLLVTCADPGLEVTGIEFDAFHQVTRFRLWTAKEPETLPFYVTIPGRWMGSRAAAQSPTAAEARTATHSEEHLAIPAYSGPAHAVADAGSSAVKSSTRGPEMLVKAGVPTELVIEGSDYRLTSTVIPLQPGALGQEVHARDPLTHKILSVQVAGPGLLKGSL